jgi:ribosomal-protein-alanine N-acetyltransferase
MEHFPALLDRDASDAAARRVRDHHDREGFGLWALEVPGVAPFIGFTGLARPSFMPVVEIGWRLARPYWAAGYATEAARASLAWGFANLGLDEIVAMVVPANVRSQRVMDRLGMVRDPTADFEHPLIAVGHPRRAHWLYRLARR